MKRAAPIAAGLVALIHVYILVLEMFLWETERGLKVFAMTAEFAHTTATLALNQGFYNGILAAGLLFGLLYRDPKTGRHIQLFFLASIAAAGIVGTITVKPSILFVQTIPALLAGVLVFLAGERRVEA